MFSDDTDIVQVDNYSDPYSSVYGWYLPVDGTIRILVIFAEIEYDVTSDPDTGVDEWVEHSLPTWADDLVDPNVPTGTAQGLLTRYYQEASYGQYNLLGDYLIAPNNGGVFKVLESEGTGPNGEEFKPALFNAIEQTMNGNFLTANGLNNVLFFDNWTITAYGQPNITPSEDSPSSIEHVMILWRNHPVFNGIGHASSGSSYFVVGNPTSSWSETGSRNKMPLSTCRHEYGHLLYGGNLFHAGGGGSHTNYFIPRAGGWSNMGLSGCSLLSWNAWDRQRLGWKNPGNVYNPAARNYNNTIEINGNLDAIDPSDAGIYYLCDFVTTGDAIKIKLPFINLDNEFPEFIWIENHNGIDLNGSPFDKWQYQSPNVTCIEPHVPGIMMYLQIDKEIRQSAIFNEVWAGWAGYIRPLTADGYHDRLQEATTIQNTCIDGGQQHAFTEAYPNPLTGDTDQGHYVYDTNGDDMIKYEDEQVNFVEK